MCEGEQTMTNQHSGNVGSSTGPSFPKASLARVICEVRRASVVHFSHRFPKASLRNERRENPRS